MSDPAIVSGSYVMFSTWHLLYLTERISGLFLLFNANVALHYCRVTLMVTMKHGSGMTPNASHLDVNSYWVNYCNL